jgi:hypothetical protein
MQFKAFEEDFANVVALSRMVTQITKHFRD